METIWYGLLGLFFAAYLVLAGYDYGVGLLTARTTDPAARRAKLTALGPFFLGNEVWLVAAVGILFGAFPMLEGELLSGLYPAVATALAGVILVAASVPLRSRPTTSPLRVLWDRLLVAGSALAALGWGAVLGGLLQGVPIRTDGHVEGVTHLLTPFVAASALTMVTLMVVHGATFLTLRLPAAAGGPVARIGRRLVPAALAALTATTALGLLSDRVRHGVRQPVAAVLLLALLAVALLLVRTALARRRPGLAFTATSVALALPVPLIGVATWPHVLVSTADPAASLTVAEAAASGPTLQLLSWLVVPLLPALLGFQLMCWWMFRGRVDGRTPVYW